MSSSPAVIEILTRPGQMRLRMPFPGRLLLFNGISKPTLPVSLDIRLATNLQ